jgi:hypothetical protein
VNLPRYEDGGYSREVAERSQQVLVALIVKILETLPGSQSIRERDRGPGCGG